MFKGWGRVKKTERKDAVPRAFRLLLNNPYLTAVRNGLTLTLPLVMAGCFAVLMINFPVAGYQTFMAGVFGENWRAFFLYIHNGTLTVMSLVMVVTIAHSLAEHYNTRKNREPVSPAVLPLVGLASLIVLIEPYADPAGLPIFWLGIHGMFLSIIVAFAASLLFFGLHRIRRFNISFYSEEADPAIPYAFGSLMPGALTIAAFAAVKAVARGLGVANLHQYCYDALSAPFAEMGNTYATAMVYNLLRHIFWFLGIHGSNLMEPVATSIYVPALTANIEAAEAGLPPPFVFTKPFFDAYTSMGGSGSTICLIIASLIYSRHGSVRKISQLSLLPALFNINEMLIFGLPIVLNPVFLVPFLAVPLAMCAIAYLATIHGFVPYTIHHVDWTAPVFISGYTASGSYAGAVLQFVNLVVGTAIYIPFVALATRVKKDTFNRAFKELMPGYGEAVANKDYVVTEEAKALSRSLTNDLARALERRELFLEYQPQVDSITGDVFGVEALMRWNHSHLGRIPPGLFIALAEEAGLIDSMGLWALDEACRQQWAWMNAGIAGVTMSVNLSVRQLDDKRLVEDISGFVNKHGIPADRLEVEVTESTALGPENDRTGVLQRIHALGVRLAIDDFGMGHSSLTYLKKFPVDTLKLDRVLTKDVDSSRHSAEIIFTIAELARSLNMTVIAEFVDNVEQLTALQNLGCTRIQGYLFSPPLSAKACADFIRKGARIYGEGAMGTDMPAASTLCDGRKSGAGIAQQP